MKSLSSSAMAYIAPPLVIEVVSTTFYGMEFVPDTFRMGCMNLMLHGVESDPDKAGIRYGIRYCLKGKPYRRRLLS